MLGKFKNRKIENVQKDDLEEQQAHIREKLEGSEGGK